MNKKQDTHEDKEWHWNEDQEEGVLGMAAIGLIVTGVILFILVPASIRHLICIVTLGFIGGSLLAVFGACWFASILILKHRYQKQGKDQS